MKKPLAIGLIGLASLVFAGGGNSGLDKGEMVSPFHPYHVSGPLAKSTGCFPCTFKNRPQVQIWVNGDDMKNVTAFASTLESAMKAHSKAEFKAMIVFISSDVDATKRAVNDFATKSKASNIALSVLAKNDTAMKNYKINGDGSVKNTVFVYKNWKVEEKFVNLSADKKGLAVLNSAIDSIVK